METVPLEIRSPRSVLHFLGAKDFAIEKAGGKAAHLHLLAKGNFRVPPGFVIPHDVPLDQLTEGELLAAVDRIGGFPVAVRSSGVLEDLKDASFAGQYDTFLNVEGTETLRRKIAECRASATNERVRTYLKKQGLSESAAKVSVLVQRMVNARTAGVGFSIQPVTGREDHALVECCSGLGEKLVSGQVTPSRYVIELSSAKIVEETLGDDHAALSRSETRDLVSVLLEAQAHFGCPQDVEWAIDDRGTFFVLQSRAVTTVQWRTDVEEFTNADFKDGGISARVCTPLMFSLYRSAMQHSMQRYFETLRLIEKGKTEQWIVHLYGRGYWNASAVKRAMSKVPGFNEEKFDQDLGIQKQYGEAGPMVVPTTVKTVVKAIPVALALSREYADNLKMVSEFGAPFALEYDRYVERIAQFQSTKDDAFFEALREVYFGFHARTERAYFTTIYNNANTQSDFKSFLEKLDGTIGRKTSIIDLIGGLSDVHHMDMQKGMLELYKTASQHGFDSDMWRVAVDVFLRDHGYHADAELDLTVPRWSEQPDRIREYVDGMLKSGAPPADPEVTVVDQKKRFEKERNAIEEQIKSNLIWRVRFLSAFKSQLERVRSYMWSRERMRQFSTQAYAIVRAYTLEAAERLVRLSKLGSPAQIFMLSIEEVDELVTGKLSPSAARARGEYRRRMYEGYRDFTPPNELGRGVVARDEKSYLAAAEGKNVLVGLGCSPGTAEGTACVVHSLDEVHTLRKGDILITKFTDPGWTPALGLVAGVVTEVGGLLSHAAVIGREYGIPAVLNLPGATKAIRSGQRVRIDGSTGKVELLG